MLAVFVAGAWVNPVLFLPLAFRPDSRQRTAYRIVTAASFTAMSTGTAAAAIALLAAGG